MEDEEQIPDIEQVQQGYEDQATDFQEYQEEMQEDQQFGNYPAPRSREGIFSFFRHILGIKDSSKVGNLDKWELGRLDLSVRNCEYLAKLGGTLHNKSFDKFFMQKAEITLATSMSKKGWLPELVVSQKKFSQRTVQPVNVGAAQPQGPRKFFNFGRNKQQPQQQ